MTNQQDLPIGKRNGDDLRKQGQDSGQKPAQDSREPGQDSQKPAQDSGEPGQDSQKPTQDSGEPGQDSQKPAQDSGEPGQDSQKPQKAGQEAHNMPPPPARQLKCEPQPTPKRVKTEAPGASPVTCAANAGDHGYSPTLRDHDSQLELPQQEAPRSSSTERTPQRMPKKVMTPQKSTGKRKWQEPLNASKDLAAWLRFKLV